MATALASVIASSIGGSMRRRHRLPRLEQVRRRQAERELRRAAADLLRLVIRAIMADLEGELPDEFPVRWQSAVARYRRAYAQCKAIREGWA